MPYAVSGCVALVWTYRLVQRAERKAAVTGGPAATPWREFWVFTAPRAMQSIVQIALQRLGIVLVSAILGPAQAAVYAAVTRFLVFGQLGSQAITAAVQPQIGALMVKKDHEGAQHIYQVSTCWLVLLCWPVYLMLAVFSRQIPLVFGHGYDSGAAVLVVLAAAMLFATGSGMVDAVLAMAGKTTWTLGNASLALVVNVGLSLLLLPHLGILGAAVAWAIGIVANNVLPLTQLAVSMRLHPFGRGTLLAMATAGFWLGGVPLLAGAVLGPAAPTLGAATVVGLAGYVLTAWRLREVFELDSLARATRRRRPAHARRAAESQRQREGAHRQGRAELDQAPEAQHRAQLPGRAGPADSGRGIPVHQRAAASVADPPTRAVAALTRTGSHARDTVSPVDAPAGPGQPLHTKGAPGRLPDRGPVPPATGSLVGARVEPPPPQGGETAATGAAEHEPARPPDVVPVDHSWDDVFPSQADVDFVHHGRTVLLSWSGTDTRAITSGRLDAQIRQRALQVKAVGAPILLRWRWEVNPPDLAGSIWSPADYVAAWRHIRAIFTEVGATNAGWVWCPVATDFGASDGPAYYPGDDQVEWLCTDVYPNQDFSSFAQASAEFLAWAASRPRPVLIGESGAQDKAPGLRREWLTQAATFVKAHPQIKGLVYYDAPHSHNGQGVGDVTLSGGTGPIRAFEQMAADPHHDQGRGAR
jgi:hypothetical protein